MELQKTKARKSHKFKNESEQKEWSVLDNKEGSKFIGYESIKTKAKITKYRQVEEKIESFSLTMG